MTRTLFNKNWPIALGIAVAFTGAAHAGEILIDFNDPDDPVYDAIEITGAGEIRFTGGAEPLTGDEGNTSIFNNPDDSGPSSGYLKVTDNANGERSEIIFPDLENGLVAGSFTIEADLRVGGGTAQPADGFSFSLVREDDPILTGGAFAGTRDLGAGEDNLPEEGTQTGVSVGFDEWVSGGTDIIGISVRVDGNVVTQQAFPTQNGAVDDDTSLQTALPGFEGATGLFLWDTNFGDPIDNGVEGLGWARLRIELTTEKVLTITYKDRTVYSEPLADYLPFAGTFVFGGRTGGANGHHHIDNISIVTTPIEGCVLSGLRGDALGFTAEITDSIDCVIDAGAPVTVTLDGTPVPVDVTKDGLVTDFRFNSVLPDVLAAGPHTVRVQAVDTTGAAFDETATFTVAAYSLIAPAWAMDEGDVDKGTGGFRMRMSQIEIGRFPGDTNSYANAERQLRDGYIDPLTGEPYENLVDPTFDPPLPGTTTWISEVLNHDQDGAGIGTIQGDEFIPGIPGTTGSTDNIAGEFSAVLDLPAGKHTLIFNSDDGFDVSFGEQPLDVRKRTSVGRFDGGRGASDTQFEIVVAEPGLYPVRIAWWEGGGGANFEFKMLDSLGTQILVNDGFEPEAIKAYANAPGAPAYLRSLSPAQDEVNVSPSADIVVQLVDGAVAVNDSTIAVSVNGNSVPVTTENGDGGLTVVRAGFPSLPDANAVQTVELSWDDANGGSDSASWSFTIADYKSLNPALASPVGSGETPGWFGVIHQEDPAFELGFGFTVINSNWYTRDQLNGYHGASVLDPLTPLDPGITAGANPGEFFLDEVVDFSQDGGQVGGFQGAEQFFPFTPGLIGDGVDNTAARFNGWFEFPAEGVYVLGVNSDDNFEMTEGHGELTSTLTVTAPAELAGGIAAQVADTSEPFGGIGAPLPLPPLSLPLVAADPILADAPLNNAAEIAGNIALIARGGVTFTTKFQHAQDAGAVAIVVYTDDRDPVVMGRGAGDETPVTIPGVMIPNETGLALAAASGVQVSLGGQTKKTLGQFNNGRGAADTTFAVNVPAPGIYPISTIWHEAGGGANIEIFSIVPGTSEKVLINDLTNPNAIKSFQSVGGGGGGGDFAIGQVSRDSVTGELTVVFSSENGTEYFIDVSSDLATWLEAGDTVGTGSETTVSLTPGDITGAGLTLNGRVYVRIRK